MISGHGDDFYKSNCPITANFSPNVYDKVDLSQLKAHLCECIGEIDSYPEPEPYTLEACITSRHHLPSGTICVTNGATEAIYLIAQTFRDTNTAILQFTFSEYAGACRMHEHRVSSLYQLPKEQDGYRLPDGVRMLWLCNPNDPTGTVVDKEHMCGLVEHNPQVCFVIDQSYEYLMLCPLFLSTEVAGYPNILLLHSVTKRYAIPGLRLGYVTGNSGLLKRLCINHMPWSVNRLATEAGLLLMENDMPAPLDIAVYLQEAAHLCKALKAIGGLDVWDTQTHFMLARPRVGKVSALKKFLAEEHDILIRDASNFVNLNEQFFRIATRTPEENNRLVAAITEFVI